MNAIPEPVTHNPQDPLDLHAAARAADLADLEIAAAAMRRVRERRGLAPDGAILGYGDCTADEIGEVASMPGGKRTEEASGGYVHRAAHATVGGARVVACCAAPLTDEQRARLREAVRP